MKNILIFGDSITYGLCDLELGGWVNRLRLHLDAKTSFDVEVFNMGRSGEISEEVLNRFDSECKSRFVVDRETMIIFAVGVNDTQDVEGNDRTDIKHFEKNILALVNKAKNFTDKITFIGLTPVDESRVFKRLSKSIKKYKSYFNEKIIKFDGVIEKVCKDKNLNYIKVFNLLTVDDLVDGLHPNSQGHQKMFKKIVKELG